MKSKKDKNPCAIVYAANDNYAKIAGISISSLLKNNMELAISGIYILDNGISKKNKDNIECLCREYQASVFFINIKEKLEELSLQLGLNHFISIKEMTTYARFLISDLLPQSIKRALYIDCDTLIIKDIQELLDFNMKNKAIGLALDCFRNEYKKYIGFPENKPYYNAGIMLIDIDLWKEKECSLRIINHLKNIRNDYPLKDQDLINMVFSEDIVCLDSKYNYLSQFFLYSYDGMKYVYNISEVNWMTKEAFIDSKKNTAILHFAGNCFGRPWTRNSKHPMKKEYDKYYYSSPWFEEKQEHRKVPIQYIVQYFCYLLPQRISEIIGKMMQTFFVYFTYLRKMK